MELKADLETWETVGFDRVFQRPNIKTKKIKASNYQEFGSFPIIDQGKKQIAGWTDDESCLIKADTNGFVIFGDHTRTLKLATEPFALGADGTQLLRVNDEFDLHFAFYLLSSKEIPNTGYNRHFKFLKEMDFLIPRGSEQIAIAETLSDIDEFILISRRLLSKKIDVVDGLVGELVSGRYFKKNGAEFTFDTIKHLGIEVKKGDLITEKTAIAGEVPVIAGGVSAAYYHNTPNRNGITVTISASGANAGYVNIWKQPIWASDCSTINESSVFDVRYLYYVLKGNQENIYRSQYGGAQPHVRPNEIERIVIPWAEKRDQKEIADLLDDFSDEIKDLETSIQKQERLKQGMMNDLLSGKVRLV